MFGNTDGVCFGFPLGADGSCLGQIGNCQIAATKYSVGIPRIRLCFDRAAAIARKQDCAAGLRLHAVGACFAVGLYRSAKVLDGDLFIGS